MTDKLAMRFWLLAMDASVRLGLFGSRPYLFAVRKASDAEWRQWPEVQP